MRCTASHFPEYRHHNVSGWLLRHLYWARRYRSIHLLVRVAFRLIFHSEIALVRLPPDVIFMHNGFSTLVHPETRFTGPALISPGVMLGGKFGRHGHEAPTIGSHVILAAGAKIFGDVRIGAYCIVDANAVVMTDMPALHRATGVPARITSLDPTICMAVWGHPVDLT